MRAFQLRTGFLGRPLEAGWQSVVVVHGKKRTKRNPPPCNPMILEDQGSVTEYLEFGLALGLSAEEAIARVRTRAEAGLITIDAEAEALIQK